MFCKRFRIQQFFIYNILQPFSEKVTEGVMGLPVEVDMPGIP